MSFVPVGFWQRFIARMLISLAEMDLQVVAFSAQGTIRLQAKYLWLCPGGSGRGSLTEDPFLQQNCWLRVQSLVQCSCLLFLWAIDPLE